MPTYNILGLQVFIPDLNDLTNAIVTPVENALNATLQNLATAIVNGLSPIWNTITGALSGVAATILSGLQAALTPVSSFLSTLYNAVLSIPDRIIQFFTGIYNAIVSAVTDVKATVLPVLQNVFSTVSSALGSLSTTIFTTLSNFFSTVSSTLSSLGATIYQDVSSLASQVIGGLQWLASQVSNALQTYVIAPLTAAFNDLKAFVLELSHDLGNVGQFVVSGFNQLTTGLNTAFQTVGNFLGTLGQVIWQGLQDYVIKPLIGAVQSAAAAVQGFISSINSAIKQTLLNVLPKTPDEAISSALLVTEAGLVALIGGEVASLAVEAIYPTKHLGIPEALHKGLDLLGITSISAALYGVIVESGWGTQLKYYFNYNLQPRRIDRDTALRGLWYGVLTPEQTRTELRYEGYSDQAIDALVNTAYRPMPPFILEKLIELQVASNDFFVKQLMREGFDPADIPDIIQAFSNLQLQGFQSNAKTLIFQMYKDGFIDEATAKQIMSVFAVPANQQNWILTMANYQFKYENQLLLRTYVLDQLGKGVLHPDDAVDALVALGTDRTRAELLVKIKAITSAPPPPKSTRATLLQEALSLPLEVS